MARRCREDTSPFTQPAQSKRRKRRRVKDRIAYESKRRNRARR